MESQQFRALECKVCYRNPCKAYQGGAVELRDYANGPHGPPEVLTKLSEDQAGTVGGGGGGEGVV